MQNKKFHYFLEIFGLLFIGLLLVELIFKLIAFKNIFVVETIRIILFTATTSALLALIFSCFKEIVSKILVLIMVFAGGLYALLQLNFKDLLGNYMSVNTAGEGGIERVTTELRPFIQNIKLPFLTCFLPFIALLILFIWKKDIFRKQKKDWKITLIILGSVVVCHFLSLATLFISSNMQIKSNRDLYKNPNIYELSLKQFGVVRFFYKDVTYKLTSHDMTVSIDTNNQSSKVEVQTDYVRYIDDSEWQEMINNESDKTIKNLHEYYINQSITPKNEYTGMFKDKNLILIMIEALDMSAINAERTPTLYKLANDGWYFDNYYTPVYSCPTGESEFIALTSIIPSSSVCTPNVYKNNTYPTAIFNLFNKSGYDSSSYHNWTDQYYARTTIHPNMGSRKFYNIDDLDITRVGKWSSDEELFQSADPLFMDKEKFFSFMITVSMHFPYDVDSTVVSKNWNQVKDLENSTKQKRYFAKTIEMDKGLSVLMSDLEEKGELDDTVIVLFGDHHPMNLDVSDLDDASSINRLEDFNIDHLPFIIYNPSLEAKTISTTASTFDILPTIANLFDLDYDPRYYVGKDIFSDEENLAIFANGSWATDRALYFSATGDYKALQDGVDDEYIKSINKIVSDKFYISNQTLSKDYYKYRFKNN